MSIVDKVLVQFEARIERVPFSDCWIWTGAMTTNGYGSIWTGIKSAKAHRFAYELFVGLIENNMHVCHRCDVPLCVNPHHLFLGTDRDNLLDSINKGRRPKSGPTRGHCKLAHLTIEQVEMVKLELSHRTETFKQLSERLGIPLHTVKNISHGTHY